MEVYPIYLASGYLSYIWMFRELNLTAMISVVTGKESFRWCVISIFRVSAVLPTGGTEACWKPQNSWNRRRVRLPGRADRPSLKSKPGLSCWHGFRNADHPLSYASKNEGCWNLGSSSHSQTLQPDSGTLENLDGSENLELESILEYCKLEKAMKQTAEFAAWTGEKIFLFFCQIGDSIPTCGCIRIVDHDLHRLR